MAEIKDYSVTADDNNATSPAGMPENMAPSGVNNSWRESFARVKRWYEDINGTKSTTGSSNAYVLAAARTVTAYAQGDAYLFRANFTNTAAVTLNVDSVGAVAIVNNTQSALAAGQIQSGGMYLVAYDASNSKFQLVGASATSASGDNIFVFNASPSVTLSNSSAEDSDGGRESSLLFKGLQSGSEESTLVKIIGSHDGSSDDQKGKLQIYTNDGADGASPTLQLTIDSAGLCTLVGAASLGSTLTVAGATQLNSTVTVGANDQGYDVILYGDTASANVTWDTSVDDLILNGAAGLIVPDGQLTLGSTAVTSTGAELNILDGVTASTAELNILDGVTSTTAELNILDGVTSTTAELNILDGVTSTAAELNLVDGSGAGSIVNSKAVIYGSGGELNGTSMDITNVATASTFEPDGDTAAGDNAAIGYTAAEGLILTGEGSLSDVTIKNDADQTVLSIPTGTTKVGIGTTAPDSLVEISSGGATTAKVATTVSNSYAEIIFEDGNAGYGFQVRSDGAAGLATGSMVINDRDTGTFPVVINEGNATNTLVVTSSKIGIGTSDPGAQLEIDGAGSSATFLMTNNATAAAGGGGLNLSIDNSLDGFLNNAKAGAIKFGTSNAERMRIDSAGRIQVNGTAIVDVGRISVSFDSANSTGVSLKATNANGGTIMRYQNSSGTSVGGITTNGSTTAFATSSDYRLKENVDYTWDGTTRLKQLKPARFNFIADESNTLVDGFIAHEVSSIVPEAIIGEKDATEMQSIDQSKLVPLLVKTIQELEARITALEAS